MRYFDIVDGLICVDGANGTWHRTRIDGLEAQRAIQVGVDNAIVLLERESKTGVVQNLVRINLSGGVLWRAEVPKPSATDHFVELRLNEDGELVVNTWGGVVARLDVRTGHISDALFTQ